MSVHQTRLQVRPTSSLLTSSDVEHMVPPPPSAILASDRPTCYSPEPPSPIEDYPEAPPINFRHRVPNAFWDNLPPLIVQATSPSNQQLSPSSPSKQTSPTKSIASFITNRSTDTTASKASTAGVQAKHTSRASLFGNFFNANTSSEAVNIGSVPSPVHSEEQDCFDEEEEMNTYTKPSRLKQLSTAQTSSKSSRFAWFTPKASALTSSKTQTTAPSITTTFDPLLNLDINSSLFPHGPSDPFDPTSFNDLLTNAEALISRLQAGYKSKCAALDALRAELDVQDEELDEAETRARHLRTQLEEMGRKREEAERVNEELTDTLLRERRLWMEEEEKRRRSVRRARSDDEADRGAVRSRRATGSTNSDSGFESEPEGEEGASAFCGQAGMVGREINLHRQEAQKSRFVRMSSKEGNGGEVRSCRNYQGGSGTQDLKSENHMLKMRVAELEDAVEGCLDLMNGPWGLRS